MSAVRAGCPSKEQLLEKYAGRVPELFMQFDAYAAGFAEREADIDGHLLTTRLTHELMDKLQVRVFVAQGVSKGELITLLRKLADMIETSDLRQLFTLLQSKPDSILMKCNHPDLEGR